MSLINFCHQLIQAYRDGLLGNMMMPEDVHPDFGGDEEKRLVFFTLPMALNYQRNSYKLRESATQTYQDIDTARVFDVQQLVESDLAHIQQALVTYKVALQPNKHTTTRNKIAQTIAANRGSVRGLLETANYDFLQLQQFVQIKYKSGFPYLSGPKIFHYWSYILGEYCDVHLANRQYIEIAPDTHVIQCSVKLGVITEGESATLTRDEISSRWRTALAGSGIDPIDMHSPLWFRSRNNFSYHLT